MLTFVKKSMEAKTKADSLVGLLDLRLSGHKPQRSHKVVHLSMLSREDGFCPREFALLDVTGKKIPHRFISTATQVAFDNGTALHDLCRNVWLRDDVVGTWKCRYCKSAFVFSRRPKVSCTKCGASLWQYHEEEFIDPKTEVTGSIDAFVSFGGSKHTLCEIKSISKDVFADLKAPLAEHRIRTILYLQLIARSGRPEVEKIDLSSGRVLYISKGYGKKNEDHSDKVLPFKEFVVEANPALAEEYFAKGLALKVFRGSGVIPEGICPNSFAKRVKACLVSEACWSGKYQAGVLK